MADFGKSSPAAVDLRRYTWLNLGLAVLHYVVSGLVAGSDDNDMFKVPLSYTFNAWTPAADDDSGTCSLGCFISEERLILQEINVSYMASGGWASRQ